MEALGKRELSIDCLNNSFLFWKRYGRQVSGVWFENGYWGPAYLNWWLRYVLYNVRTYLAHKLGQIVSRPVLGRLRGSDIGGHHFNESFLRYSIPSPVMELMAILSSISVDLCKSDLLWTTRIALSDIKPLTSSRRFICSSIPVVASGVGIYQK